MANHLEGHSITLHSAQIIGRKRSSSKSRTTRESLRMTEPQRERARERERDKTRKKRLTECARQRGWAEGVRA